MKKWMIPVSVGVFSSFFCACGVKQAVAPRTEVIASAMENIKREDVTFASNQLFLWPSHVSHQQVSKVLYLSDEMDRLEKKITPVKNRLQSLQKEVQDMEVSNRKKKTELISVKGKITKQLRVKQTELRKQKAQLEELQKSEEVEKAKAVSDPEVLKKLETEIQSLQNLKLTLEGEIKNFEDQSQAIDHEIESLSQNPLAREFESLQVQNSQDEAVKKGHLNKVMNIVFWYVAQPSEISFKFQQGVIQVDIKGWRLTRYTDFPHDEDFNSDKEDLTRQEEKLWDFSTAAENGKKPTIENVKYRDYGGLFEFDVKVYEDEAQTQLREFYSFRVARTKYDSNDGKIYYSGTVKRTRVNPDGTKEVRDGIAKLVDKNN